MAEVDTGSKGGGKKGPKKVSTKIDMTPMVDLAFLLITFFMLTTTFSKPKTMELNMPDKTKDPEKDKQKVEETRTTTIILGKKDRIFYYTGIQDPTVETTDYSANGVRKMIMQKIREKPKGKDPIFIIKAMDEARYKNMVDILDEMRITGAQIYALVDITPGDVELVDKYKQEHNIND